MRGRELFIPRAREATSAPSLACARERARRARTLAHDARAHAQGHPSAVLELPSGSSWRGSQGSRQRLLRRCGFSFAGAHGRLAGDVWRFRAGVAGRVLASTTQAVRASKAPLRRRCSGAAPGEPAPRQCTPRGLLASRQRGQGCSRPKKRQERKGRNRARPWLSPPLRTTANGT